MINKQELSERDICTKLVIPAIRQAGCQQHQFREEVSLADGRVIKRGRLAVRVNNPIPEAAPSVPLLRSTQGRMFQPLFVEAKQVKFSVGHGMQQALNYAEVLHVPFAVSSNGNGFLIHDRTSIAQPAERERHNRNYYCGSFI